MTLECFTSSRHSFVCWKMRATQVWTVLKRCSHDITSGLEGEDWTHCAIQMVGKRGALSQGFTTAVKSCDSHHDSPVRRRHCLALPREESCCQNKLHILMFFTIQRTAC